MQLDIAEEGADDHRRATQGRSVCTEVLAVAAQSESLAGGLIVDDSAACFPVMMATC
jgi:hypothetical protein